MTRGKVSLHVRTFFLTRVIQHRTRISVLGDAPGRTEQRLSSLRAEMAPGDSSPSHPDTSPTPPRCQAAALTLHDLLQLHLQGLHGPARVVSGRALDAVDGQTPVHHGRHIIILQEDHTVGVLNHSTVGTQGTSHPALGRCSPSSQPTCSSGVEEFPRLLNPGHSCKVHFHPANGTGFFFHLAHY